MRRKTKRTLTSRMWWEDCKWKERQRERRRRQHKDGGLVVRKTWRRKEERRRWRENGGQIMRDEETKKWTCLEKVEMMDCPVLWFNYDLPWKCFIPLPTLCLFIYLVIKWYLLERWLTVARSCFHTFEIIFIAVNSPKQPTQLYQVQSGVGFTFQPRTLPWWLLWIWMTWRCFTAASK